MRLIDADALMKATKKEMRYVEKHAIPYEDMDTGHMVGLRWAERAIANAPTIDAVTVVRCKDCRWWDKTDNGFGYCHAEKHCHISAHWEISIFRTYRGDHFCSDGERKDNEGVNA